MRTHDISRFLGLMEMNKENTNTQKVTRLLRDTRNVADLPSGYCYVLCKYGGSVDVIVSVSFADGHQPCFSGRLLMTASVLTAGLGSHVL